VNYLLTKQIFFHFLTHIHDKYPQNNQFELRDKIMYYYHYQFSGEPYV